MYNTIDKDSIEIIILNQIKAAFPSYTDEQSEAALLLLKARASTLEMAFDEYIGRYHPDGIAKRDDELPDEYKGYIEFLGADAASVIHAGRGADFSTFIHECAHVFRRQLAGELKERAAKAFNIQNGEWTAGREEYFAKGLEQWIKRRHGRDLTRKAIYEKGAVFINNVYKGVEHIIDITPEMEAVYERLFENNNKFNQSEYEDILNNITAGKTPETSHVYLGMTPRIYEEFGFERLPMMITSKHLYTTLRDDGVIPAQVSQNINYHDLGEDILKQIPEQLKKPLAVIQSGADERDIISVIEMRDKNNNPVIIPLTQFGKGNFNNLEIDINLIKTIYGKDNFERWIRTAIDDDRLLFVDKKRTERALNGKLNHTFQSPSILPPGVQFPAKQDVSGFFINNIARYKGYVKEHSKNSAVINGERVLFQVNANQLAFDFGDDDERSFSPRNVKVVKNEGETISVKKSAGELSVYENFLSDFIALSKNEEYSGDRIEAARNLLRASYAPFKQSILLEMKERGCVSPETSRSYLWGVLENAREAVQYSERYIAREFDFAGGDVFKVSRDDEKGIYTVLIYDENDNSIGYGRDDNLSVVENWLKEHGAQDGWELNAADGDAAADENAGEPLSFSGECRPYGAWLGWNKRLSEKQRLEVNQKVIELLQSGKEFTEDEKDVLRRYSGFGGVKADDERGVLYDYYTSPPLARMTWRLLDKISPAAAGGRALEPSCGAGVFIDNAPEGFSVTGVELDGRAAAAAKVLQKNADILNMSFEQFNLSDKSGGYDVVIGNVPFGERPADIAEIDAPDEKSLDNYFVSRSIDNLKDGGAAALITAPGVLNNMSNEGFRLALSKKAQFLGAVQLPNKSFFHTHTGVQPVILLFKKYPADIARRVKNLDDKEFENTVLYDRDFVEGSYFKTHPGHIMGEVSRGAGQFGSDEITGSLTPDGVENTLSSFTPADQFDEAVFDRLREKYARPEENEKAARRLALSNDELLKFQAGDSPSIKIFDNGLWILADGSAAGSRWDFISGDKTLIDKMERVTRLADMVRSVREAMKTGNESAKLYQSAASAVLETYKSDYGEYPANDRDVLRFVKKHPAVKGVYDAFITPSSEVLASENIYAAGAEIVDGHNPAVRALEELQKDLIPASDENIRARFPADAENLIGEMYANKDIFYTPKGLWRLREDFISGDAWRKIDALREAAAGVDDGVLKEKLLYGASELEKAAGWTPVEEADFSPRSAWIDELIIQQWVSGGDALDNGELADLAKNPEGKWGVMDGGVWTEYNHPLVYYLNGQRQRSKNIDTKAFNEEHDELFKAYISNHDGFRQSIERKYNRLFKTNLTAPVKTYPVEIKGWRGADAGGKTLKPHQWQTIHHLYRQGAGISALGTGFGKTASAIGLMSLLRQEGKSSRVWLQVPNNKVKDWAAEIKDVMPSLKIASIDPEESGYSSRGKRYARYWEIANSRADVIIMPESAASEIQLKKDNDYLIREKIAGDYKTEKRIAGASKRLTAKAELKALSDTQNGKTNRIINFEDFGCDALFVDEAHNYKNLFSSSLSRETGLNDGRQSAKAMALFKKADFIRENNDGKNVFLLTATPLTNSPLEYYNMLQYIAGGELKRFGVCSIDGFIKEFADVKEGMKYDWTKNKAGWGKILAGFKNLQTLQDLFFKYTDLQNDPRAAGIEKPEPRNTPNLIPSDDAQVSVLKAVSAEIERYRSMDKDEREIEFPGQNFLTFYSQMRTASLDLEMFDPDAYKGWKNPKLEALSFNVKNIYDDAKGGQVVFCDRIFDSDARFNLHDKIKSALVERGFKDDEIVIINGFTKSGDKRADGAVERDVSKAVEGFNSGKYKVIIGTTACIGEGVNLQKNSAAVHHFDIPFRPSDFIQRNGRVDRQGNAQDKVELHTYLATGTIDNYSAALVQNKANWIDKLLRTKSNVFTNPDDENAVDMNELLLSLTEEWGDSEKAASMREELRRQKEDAERAAWDKKMRSNIKSLSLLRCALQSLKNKDSNDYKNRIDKIHNLERALSGNPLFTKHDIIGNTEPFLYNAKYDVIIREGDILFRNDLEIVAGFDFKKQSFSVSSFRNPSEKNKYPVSQIVPLEENNKLSYRERVYNPLKFNFARPSDVQKKLLLSLNDAAAFYDLPDKNAVKDYYKYHLLCFSSWRSDKSSEPPVFNVDNDGKLSVGYARYSVNDGNGFVDALNPFDPNDMQKLLAAARRGLNLNYSEHDALYSLSKKYFPDLHAALIPRFKALDDVSINKKIIDDYRDSGFDSASQDVAVNQKVVDDYSDRSFASPSYSGSYSASRNENIVSKENQEMETIQNLNDQAGETAGRSFSPDVLADTAAKYHAEHGASEWRSPDGGLRLYFNFAAKKNLYGLSTYSQTDLSPEKTVEYRRLYRSAKLPPFPEKALQNGRPVSPEKAFEILCSTPYYDVNQKKMFGLLPDVQTKIDYLKQRSLDMGGKEYIDADKGRHRIYFQSPTAVKNLYGLETKGKTVLNEEKEAAMRKKFPFVKYLPVMPEAASLRGEPVDPQRAFDMLASRPYFDVNSGKFELFSKEKTFDMFFEKEFNKDGVSDERRSELLGLSAEHDARVKINVKEAAVFAAEMKTAPSLKDMSQAQQLKVFFQSAVENNNAPWDRQFGASAAFPPFNFESGRNFSRSNLVSASLHMAHIGSKDPRYLTEDKIQKAGLAVDDNAAPLKIAYRVQDRDGSYKSKTTVYYNAKNIAGLPPLVLPKSINELSSQPIAPERAANANDQITNNIAGFIAAMSSNRAFQPLASGVKQENYKELLAAPVSDLFSKINAASSKAAELSLDKKELQLERGGRAAGMDM